MLSCMLILGIPLHVFHPILLFYLADEEQDVRFTPAEKRGQVETQRWTWRLTPRSCHQRGEINGERKTSKGKLTIFLKATRKFLIISTQRPVTSTETATH